MKDTKMKVGLGIATLICGAGCVLAVTFLFILWRVMDRFASADADINLALLAPIYLSSVILTVILAAGGILSGVVGLCLKASSAKLAIGLGFSLLGGSL